MNFIYLLGPSIGAFDIWHPVLLALRNKGIQLSLLITKPAILSQFDQSNPTHRDLPKLFSNFICSLPNETREFASFYDLFTFYSTRLNPSRTSRLFARLRLLSRNGTLKPSTSGNLLFIDQDIRSTNSLILYDAGEELKGYNQHLQALFKSVTHKFHMPHGLGIHPVLSTPSANEPYPFNLTYLLQGETEKSYIHSLFPGSTNSAFLVCGIPRHDPLYLDSLRQKSSEYLEKILTIGNPINHIGLLVGRSSISYYYGTERCFQQSVTDIEETFLSDDSNILLIKNHPREPRLPRPLRQLIRKYPNCIQVDLPPLNLSPFIDIAFTAHSGTCVDFALYKVSSLEHINLAYAKNLYHDTTNSPYSRSGMTISSHSSLDLANLLSDSSLKRNGQTAFKAYQQQYHQPKGAIQKIVNALLEKTLS